MKSFAGRSRAGRVLLGASALLLVAVGAAQASPAQPQLVSQVAQAGTPEVVASQAVAQPHDNAFAPIGTTMYSGGLFDTIKQGGTSYTRNNVMAFDTATGAVSGTWTPSVDGQVFAMVADPSTNSVYVGGVFANVNGVSRGALVKLDATTGAADPSFVPPFNSGQINTLQLVTINGVKHLFVGGSSYKKLESLNPATGKDDKYFANTITDGLPGAWGGVAVYQIAIDPSQTHLIATGNFQTVNGQSRSKFFMMDLGSTSASLDAYYYPGFAKVCSSTAPRRIANLQGVDWSPDGSYFDITATGQIPKNKSDIWYSRLGTSNIANTTVCDGFGRFALNDSTKPVWINYTGGDSVWRAADTGAAIYVSGHFKWVDNPDGYASYGIGDKVSGAPASYRPGIAAVDPTTGLAANWNPKLSNTVEGGKALYVVSGGLWIGNDATAYNGDAHNGLEFAPIVSPAASQVVWAVGEGCMNSASPACAQVGQMISQDTSTTAVLGLGNLQYATGAASDWSNYYDPAMGAGVGLKSKTYPVPGDVDYKTPSAAGYFSYWGAQAGDASQGYYSTDLGDWRVVATNSNCSKVGGCGGPNPQGAFMRSALLDKDGPTCQLVFDNAPAYSDGPAGDQAFGKSLFSVANNNGADLFVSAHDDSYQRFPAMDASGALSANGLTQFVVGTGGQPLTGFQGTASRSSFRQNTELGAVRFVLSATGWTSEFHGVDGSVMDAASGTCH